MKQTLVYLPEEQHEALRNRAHESRTSISELVRLAVEAFLTREHPPMPRLPKKEAIKEAQEIIKQAEVEQPLAFNHKCGVPQFICRRVDAEQYMVEYFVDEGLEKRKVWLCPEHAKRTREAGQSIVKLIQP